MSISRTIAKNTLFNFISTATDVVVSLVVSILLARGLGAEQYGLYSFLMWFLSLASLVVNLGMGDMVRRYIAEALGKGNKDTTSGIIRLTLIIRSVATLLLSILLVGLSSYLTQVFTEVNNSYYFMLVALTLFPQMATTTIASIFTGFQNYEYNAYVDLVISPLRLVGIFVMMAMGYGVEEIMLMLAGLFFLGLLLQIYFLNRLMPLGSLVSGAKLDSGVRKDAIKYAMTLMGTQGLNYFIWSQAEVLFLGLYCTIEDIAYYNLAFKIPRMVITLIPYVFGRVLLPTVAEQFGKGDMDKIKTIYITSARYLMMLTFPIVVGGIVLAAPLINVLYGLEYQPSIALMQIIFIPFSTIGLTHASTSIIYGINKPSFILKTGIPLVIIVIGLYLWAVPRYGVMGAAITGSVPRISVFFIYNYYVYRKIGVHWPFGDTIRVIAASGIMGAAVFGIRSFTNDTLSLVIGIIFGAIIFLITLIALRFVTQQEIGLLRKFQKRIPSAFKGKYSTMVNLVETFARKSSS